MDHGGGVVNVIFWNMYVCMYVCGDYGLGWLELPVLMVLAILGETIAISMRMLGIRRVFIMKKQLRGVVVWVVTSL